MRYRKGQLAKDRREAGAFVAMPTSVLNSHAVIGLSANGKRLLLDLCAQFRIGHNGDLSPSRTLMKRRGWTSHSALDRAIKELVKAGVVELTRQGGLHQCSLYGFTWMAIDECGGKLDGPGTNKPSGLWRKAGSEPGRIIQFPSPRRGPHKPVQGRKGGTTSLPTTIDSPPEGLTRGHER